MWNLRHLMTRNLKPYSSVACRHVCNLSVGGSNGRPFRQISSDASNTGSLTLIWLTQHSAGVQSRTQAYRTASRHRNTTVLHVSVLPSSEIILQVTVEVIYVTVQACLYTCIVYFACGEELITLPLLHLDVLDSLVGEPRFCQRSYIAIMRLAFQLSHQIGRRGSGSLFWCRICQDSLQVLLVPPLSLVSFSRIGTVHSSLPSPCGHVWKFMKNIWAFLRVPCYIF